MKTYFFFVSVCIGFALADERLCNDVSNITIQKLKSETHLDVLIEQLTAHTWSADEKQCLGEILKTINNVKNTTLWASRIWDSIQLPVGLLYGSKYQLGNYDQCLRETVGSSQPPFRTQYCLADIVLGCNEQSKRPSAINSDASTEEYICSKTEMKQSFNVITWGVCVPESCRTESVKTFLRALLKQSHLGHLQTPLNITVTRCEPAGETKKHIDGFNIVLIAALAMVAFVLFCTMYISGGRQINSNTFTVDTMKCFCLKRNTKDWLQRPKNDVQVLHGIRFISTCLIMLLHMFFIPMTVAVGNSLDFEEYLHGYMNLIKMLLMIVDTFFVISGLLHVKNTKPGSTFLDHVHLLIKRYFRLIWWYLATALVILVILPRTGCGPLCARMMSLEHENCKQSWWAGLLMLENYIAKGCNPAAWYIFCDFHLTVLASILIWLHHRSARVAVACFSVAAALSILLPASVVYNMPELINLQVDFDVYNVFRGGERSAAIDIYMDTHHRASPYLVGLMMGYVMTHYGAEAFRRIITKRKFLISLLSFLFLGILTSLQLNENIRAAVLLISSRLIWACMTCALIAVCEYGSLPYVKDLLSCSIFVPLSKLSYGIYLVHPITIAYTSYSPRGPQHFNGYIMIEKYLGNLTLCCIISLFFLLFVEAPLNNFVKLLCNYSTKSKPDRVDIRLNGEAMPETQRNIMLDYKRKVM